jgi:hypothetical protein
MVVVTMNDIPGYEVEEVIGEVFGLTVRSRNVGSYLMSALRSLFPLLSSWWRSSVVILRCGSSRRICGSKYQDAPSGLPKFTHKL